MPVPNGLSVAGWGMGVMTGVWGVWGGGKMWGVEGGGGGGGEMGEVEGKYK